MCQVLVELIHASVSLTESGGGVDFSEDQAKEIRDYLKM
jgi:hypothetical protein